MASCSIREELIAQYPTCIDSTTISSPTVRVTTVPIPHGYSNYNSSSITKMKREKWCMLWKTEKEKLLFTTTKDINCLVTQTRILTTVFVQEVCAFGTSGVARGGRGGTDRPGRRLIGGGT